MESRLLDEAYTILDQAIAEHHPSHAFAMFSGGYDSLITTHLTLTYMLTAHPEIKMYVGHVNTGIGIEQTREFVRTTCQYYGWPLKEYRSVENYEDIVMQHGFPGPSSHRYMYIKLKERAVDQLIREHKQYMQDRILLVTGVRKQESVRRMGHVTPIQRYKTRVWVAPLLNWSKDDILDYMATYQLPRNEVVDTLHMSGECLCGSYAHKGELAEIETWYPEMGCYLRCLQERVKATGNHWEWEKQPAQWRKQVKDGQEFLPGFSLCTSCDARFEQMN